MTAPVFVPADIHNYTYYVENLAVSTPENRQCYYEAAQWAVVGRPDGQPVTGATNRRFWANVPASEADFASDDRYETKLAHDFIPYSPNPNDTLPADAAWPFGVRRQRVVKTLKSPDELKTLVLTRQVEANAALWPGDALDQRTAEYAVLSQQAQRSEEEAAFVADYELRVAGQRHNRLVMHDCFRAIDAGESFTLETGTANFQWVTSVDEPAT